jgi:hypothetical protein
MLPVATALNAATARGASNSASSPHFQQVSLVIGLFATVCACIILTPGQVERRRLAMSKCAASMVQDRAAGLLHSEKH